MGFLSNLFGGNDHERAATKYAGRESATESASRQRRTSHRNNGATRAARQGQAWEDADRQREKNRGRRR
jgi:hypothetical protein